MKCSFKLLIIINVINFLFTDPAKNINENKTRVGEPLNIIVNNGRQKVNHHFLTNLIIFLLI